jgi:hypothetical protein
MGRLRPTSARRNSFFRGSLSPWRATLAQRQCNRDVEASVCRVAPLDSARRTARQLTSCDAPLTLEAAELERCLRPFADNHLSAARST